jgi:uncharacterized protein (DUF2249 family)
MSEILIDARAMVPPEPFEHTMEALDRLGPGDEVVLLLNREPHPLYQVLRKNGYVFESAWSDDGTITIRIRQP